MNIKIFCRCSDRRWSG